MVFTRKQSYHECVILKIYTIKNYLFSSFRYWEILYRRTLYNLRKCVPVPDFGLQTSPLYHTSWRELQKVDRFQLLRKRPDHGIQRMEVYTLPGTSTSLFDCFWNDFKFGHRHWKVVSTFKRVVGVANNSPCSFLGHRFLDIINSLAKFGVIK